MRRPPELCTLVCTDATRLVASLGHPQPLAYSAGANPAEGLPAYVRAASAIRRRGARLMIVQET